MATADVEDSALRGGDRLHQTTESTRGIAAQWFLASALGVATGLSFYLMAVTGVVIDLPTQPDDTLGGLWELLVVSGLAGAAAGVVQWMMLRRFVSRAGWWVASTSVGWLTAIIWWIMTDYVAAAGGVATGYVTGAFQWLVLRRSASGAAWWVPTSVVGMTVALAATGWLAEAQADLSGYVATSLVAGVLGGLVYALATAGPLVWMLRLPRRVSVD